MEEKIDKERRLPPIGLRIIKSAIGVMLCFCIYMLRGQRGEPFYSALAVLWCIQSYSKDTISNAIQRFIGTAVGAVFGMLVILLEMHVVDLEYGPVHFALLSVFIIPVIYTTVVMGKKNASYFACVVYLSIVVNHIVDVNPFIFVLDRSLDTLIGIAVGIVVNMLHFHGAGDKNVLFVADFDGQLKKTKDKLTPYAKVNMKNMISEGMLLTFMTTKTPAAYLESMSDIRPNLPIIAMDGAILYDQHENSYPRVYIISANHARRLEERIHEEGFGLFTTVILDDVLLIYFDELRNEAQKQIYGKLHKSPYRNYLRKPRPEEHPVVYYMLIDTDERVKNLYDKLRSEGMFDGLKVLTYPADEYPGYSYIKIYNENASVDNMIDYLKTHSGKERVITISDHKSKCVSDFKEVNADEMVKRMQKLFYYGSLKKKQR